MIKHTRNHFTVEQKPTTPRQKCWPVAPSKIWLLLGGVLAAACASAPDDGPTTATMPVVATARTHAAVRHTFRDPGVYTVQVRACNGALCGDPRSLTLTIVPGVADPGPDPGPTPPATGFVETTTGEGLLALQLGQSPLVVEIYAKFSAGEIGPDPHALLPVFFLPWGGEPVTVTTPSVFMHNDGTLRAGAGHDASPKTSNRKLGAIAVGDEVEVRVRLHAAGVVEVWIGNLEGSPIRPKLSLDGDFPRLSSGEVGVELDESAAWVLLYASIEAR